MPPSRILTTPLRLPTLPRPLYQTTTTTLTRAISTTTSLKTLISDSIRADHRALEHAYTQILTAKTNDEKARWQNQFTWDLAPHSISEEIVLYPAMETHLSRGGGGGEVAEKDRVEHKIVQDLLYKFQSLHPTSEEFIPNMSALEKTLHKDESGRMVSSFDRTKRFVPTRSHPAAPDRPPFETVVGLMAAPVDRLMDLYREFPEEGSRGRT
ncbi:hemerythrin domain-containing protein [Aspergillus ibericus CBS 121593]|uniref:Hemerythrin-like domain-containing protein n=1 Tax=Aspergillus ibericus CBS 121593 TaxID=1448316 RepID=A0A395GU44_9EURO|nr:hypothetical protein BO80DRAFT_479676 [Aspergillus ibericus CBS 121593]RAK98478.1 hypothetical protein BO80DRAFT_479676 [Aspergillus ibericus CBS 121593]